MPRHVAIICDGLDAADPVTQPSIELAADLVRDGYRVSLLTAGPIDVDVDEGVDVFTFEAGARLRWLGILRFRRWVARTLAGLGADRTVSLNSTMTADLLVPMRGLLQARIEHRLLQAESAYQRLIKRLTCLLPGVWLPRSFEKQALSHESLKAVVALSPRVAASLRSANVRPGAAIQSAHLPIMPTRVDTAGVRTSRDKLARALGLDPEAYWVTFPFTWSGAHGLEPLIRALKPFVDQGSDAVLLLAGPTRYTHFAWIAELGLRERVRFVGKTARLDVLLPCSDLAVYPADYDPVGWGVLAALGSGRPIITTAASGLADAVEARGGTVLPSPAQPQALLQAMRAHHAAWQGGAADPAAPEALKGLTLAEAVKALLAESV
ncbi:MAG: glycosyltransferase family 4 protein [Phycisphaeraceae bacterium]|nr:glycosyltransferase family 4 protein [Phycisphaeraceae bacterium]